MFVGVVCRLVVVGLVAAWLGLWFRNVVLRVVVFGVYCLCGLVGD